MEHRNPDYFPDLPLPASLKAVSDPQEAINGADFVVLAVPSQALRSNLSQWRIPENAIVVSLAKGIELGTGLRMSEVIAEAGSIAAERIVVVTGPNLARRSPSGSRRRVLWQASRWRRPKHSRRSVIPRVSARTPTPMWSDASSAGRRKRDCAGCWHGDGARPGAPMPRRQ